MQIMNSHSFLGPTQTSQPKKVRRCLSSLLLPHSGLMNGYPCFVVSIAMIGVCTAVIGDVASHLGCFIFLKDTVNAIAFVALGTSVPGTEDEGALFNGASSMHTVTVERAREVSKEIYPLLPIALVEMHQKVPSRHACISSDEH